MLRHCRFLLTGALVVGLLALPAISVAGQPSKQVTNPPSMFNDLHDSATMGPAVEKDPQEQQTAKITKQNSITQKAPATRRQVIDSPRTGASVNLKGLRDAGDITGDFYNAFELYTTYDIGWSYWGDIQNNDFGEDVYIARPAVPNTTYAIHEVGFHILRVTSTTVETWARITVYDNFYKDIADDYTYDTNTCPSGDPMVHSSRILGQAVFNLGTDDDDLCNYFDRYIVNLVTGEVYDDFEGAIDPNLYMIGNTSPSGYIAAGPGGNHPIFITVELGTGSNDNPATFTDAPPDDCTDTLPGGVLIFFTPTEVGEFDYFEKVELNTISDAFAGATGNGYHNDGQNDDDNEWNCGDAIAWPVPLNDEHDRMWPPLLLLRGDEYPDCNGNGVPDDTDIAGSTSVDVLGRDGVPDGKPDECQTGDCNANNCWDLCDLYPNCVPECNDGGINPGCGSTALPDCNADDVLDSCQLLDNDCNNNSIPDDCDILEGGSSHDCNENGIPEECEFADGLIPDCNGNGEPDSCDVDSLDGQPAYSPDCDDNDVPDECQIRSDSPAPGGPFFCTNGCSADCDFTGVPDHCERFVRDCNHNGLDDYCDIHIYGEAVDANTNNIPDLCDMGGKRVMIDFEDKDPVQYPDVENLYDWNYVDGPLNEQPIDEDAGDGSYFYADWSVIEYDDESGEYVGEVTDSDACDAITQTMGSSSTRHMKFKTRAFRPQVAATPQIHMADPNWDVVNAYTPMIQTLSMDVMFEQPSYRVDWDLFVDSIFDDGDNAWNVAIGFSTKETAPESGVYYGEIDVYHDLDAIHTGVNWFTSAGAVHNLKIEVDFGRTLGYFADAGKIYWDGTEIATFTPRIDYETGLLPVMDRVSFQNDSNGFTDPIGSSYFHVDNIELYHSDGSVDCEAYMSDDCDGNGICDVFDLQYFTDIDDNNNGIIDECEWKCNDCNFNGTLDDIDIAGGTAIDANANGVIDGCEAFSDTPVTGSGYEGLIGFNTADGFVDGKEMTTAKAKYSGGWAAMGSASQAAISSDGSVTPTEGDLFLQIKSYNDRGFGWIYGPRQQASDNDIEIWCWDMHVNQLGFDAVYVEIADFCEDGADSYSDFIADADLALDDLMDYTASTGANYPPVYAGVNTGMAIRGNDGLITFQEYASATGAVTYESAGENIETNQWGTFAIVVENSTGNTWLFYDADRSNNICSRDLIGFEQVSSSSARPLYYQQYLSENSETPDALGDKQLLIRSSWLGDGAANVKFSFDNFRYLAFDDCDANSLPDEFSIESGQVSDHNSDGIPDNCQDCDNSCAGLWEWDTTPARRKSLLISETNAQACVDSFQIATDPDCNGNGQIDACELDATLPYVGAEVTSNNCAGTSPRVECWQYRDADKACDADATGTMDACEVAPETPVEDWDCNGNGCFDTAEIAAGTAPDVDGDGKPDECMVDCNLNNRDDALDIGQQVGDDYVSCDLWPATSAGDGRPDECCMIEIIEHSGLYEPAEPSPDLDHDGDIDVIDYRRLQECEGVLAGSVPRLNTDPPSCLGADTSINGPCPKCHCGCADFNKDGVVDETDVLYFKLRMTGP